MHLLIKFDELHRAHNVIVISCFKKPANNYSRLYDIIIDHDVHIIHTQNLAKYLKVET